MKEYRQIVSMMQRESCPALVSLVRAHGSSYRKPGAHLLVGTGGTFAGTLSGGCLEAEVVRKAAWLVKGGVVVQRYSTFADDGEEVPYGLGCGGIVDLLFEPTDTAECRALIGAMDHAIRGAESFSFSRIHAGTRRLTRAVLSKAGDVLFASDAMSNAELSRMQSYTQGIGAAVGGDLYIERVAPPQHLLIVGAGDGAKPLVALAAMLGWRITVVDGRVQLARPERFPEAEVLVEQDAGQAASRVTESDAVAIMSHSYVQDRDWLAALLPRHPRYLGILGARHRSAALIQGAAVRTGLSLAECCNQVCAPMGLALGGDGPEMIALATIAEIQAACSGESAATRKLSPSQVLELAGAETQRRYEVELCALSFA